MAKVKEDCFAYSKAACTCKALNATYCAVEENCKFYKTKEQVQKEQKGKKHE